MTALTEAPSPLALWAAGAAILALILIIALFSTTEAAIAAASRSRLHGLAERDAGAARALRLGEDRERLAASIALGRMFCTVAAAALSTWLFATLAGGVGRGAAISVVLLTVALAYARERLPRRLAAADPEARAARAAALAGPLLALIAPVAAAIAGAVRPAPPPASDAAPVTAATEEPAPEDDRARLLDALDLGSRSVDEVMMHRRDIEMIDADAEPAAIVAQAIDSSHTRLPIFRGEPENIVGVVHAKDLLRAVHAYVVAQPGAGRGLDGFDVMTVAMEPYFVPESTPLDEQMREFLRRRSHFALVIDEYGALQGLVTLEDILEEIVGDITDEHDIEEPAGIAPQPDGSVEVDGAIPIRELNRARDWDLPDEEANTIAGLVIHAAQSIPNPGQSFTFQGFQFDVLERDGNRLARLRVRRLD